MMACSLDTMVRIIRVNLISDSYNIKGVSTKMYYYCNKIKNFKRLRKKIKITKQKLNY